MIKPSRSAVGALVLAASTVVGIAGWEGYRSEAYIPVPGDVPTIGFGSTKNVKMGDKTTPDRALRRLVDEVDSVYAQGIRRCIKVPLTDYEFGAYVSLAYNIGVPLFCNKADKRTVDDQGRPRKPDPDQLIDLINSQQYAEACKRIDAFVYSGGRKLQGLVNRRAEERKICEGRG